MKELLQSKGLSVTKQRLALLETLNKANKPVTIDEISSLLETPMDTSTMYRSIKVLVDHGLVYQTDFREGVSYFEFQGDQHHHHMVCTACKARKRIDVCMSSSFDDLSKKHSFTITNHIFEIFGLCENCS
ncbi:MAG: transcriptional repressor [Candidatus Pacebacteria bacterium]|nr:transcriptional repressor [Candidatus Paceibacterota bacterium]